MEQLPGGTETILLVEDEELVRDIAYRLLIRKGYTVIATSSGQEALDHLTDREGDVHLLISDILMPGMNGHELAREVRKLYPEIEIIFISGYNSGSARRQEPVEPDVELLEKPFTPGALLRKVRQVLDKEP